MGARGPIIHSFTMHSVSFRSWRDITNADVARQIVQYRILYFQPGHVGNTSFSNLIWIFELPQLATLVLKQFSNIRDIGAVYLLKEKIFNIRRLMLSQITISGEDLYPIGILAALPRCIQAAGIHILGPAKTPQLQA